MMNNDFIISKYTFSSISGRYVTPDHLDSFYTTLGDDFEIVEEGFSVQQRPIKSVRFGSGKTKIFMWSQMHGNETTTTKAVVDLLNFLNSKTDDAKKVKEEFTLLIIPILNPDGAFAYTRMNANNMDLNRDSVVISQPESKVLRALLDNFQPNYAFNLHDQRTIFGVGDIPMPATISFLAPSYDENRSINSNRKEAMQLIIEINKELQTVIPNQVGRFDDSFNLNCIGDYAQALGISTILFEAGHFPKDYEREETRKIVFRSLLVVLNTIMIKTHKEYSIEQYFDIPENKKIFNDVILRKVWDNEKQKYEIVTLQYIEELFEKKIIFKPIIVAFGEKDLSFAHIFIDEELQFKNIKNKKLSFINEKAFDVIDFDRKSVNDLLNN